MSASESDLLEPFDGNSEPEPDYAARKRRILIWLLVYSASLGVIAVFEDEGASDPVVDFVLGVPLLILGIYWCRTDAAQRDHDVGTLTSALLVLVFVVGLPLYLFQTRGLKAFAALAWLVLILAAMFVSMTGGIVAGAFVQELQASAF